MRSDDMTISHFEYYQRSAFIHRLWTICDNHDAVSDKTTARTSRDMAGYLEGQRETTSEDCARYGMIISRGGVCDDSRTQVVPFDSPAGVESPLFSFLAFPFPRRAREEAAVAAAALIGT